MNERIEEHSLRRSVVTGITKYLNEFAGPANGSHTSLTVEMKNVTLVTFAWGFSPMGVCQNSHLCAETPIRSPPFAKAENSADRLLTRAYTGAPKLAPVHPQRHGPCTQQSKTELQTKPPRVDVEVQASTGSVQEEAF